MKIPSIIKTPKYQRFHVEPRYYDPVKEELMEREARIKRNVEADRDVNGEFPSSIQGTFTRRRRTKGGSASLVQFIIMILLAGLIFGYIYLGEIALYIIVLISSVLLYLKMKRIL